MSGGDPFEIIQQAIDAHAALALLPAELAAEAVEPLRKLIAANIAAQVSPSGAPWKTGSKGQPVLLGAASALTVTSRGATLTAKLTGPEARHNNGSAAGGVKRQILPSRNSLAGVAKILRDIVKRKQGGK